MGGNWITGVYYKKSPLVLVMCPHIRAEVLYSIVSSKHVNINCSSCTENYSQLNSIHYGFRKHTLHFMRLIFIQLNPRRKYHAHEDAHTHASIRDTAAEHPQTNLNNILELCLYTCSRRLREARRCIVDRWPRVWRSQTSAMGIISSSVMTLIRLSWSRASVFFDCSSSNRYLRLS